MHNSQRSRATPPPAETAGNSSSVFKNTLREHTAAERKNQSDVSVFESLPLKSAKSVIAGVEDKDGNKREAVCVAVSTAICADTVSGGDTDDAVSFSREQEHLVFKRRSTDMHVMRRSSRQSLRVATRHTGVKVGHVSVPSNTELAHDCPRVALEMPGTYSDLKPLDPDAPVRLEDVAGEMREVFWMVELSVSQERNVSRGWKGRRKR